MTIQTVPVEEGKDSAHLPSGDIWSNVFDQSSVFSMVTTAGGCDLLRRKTYPRRTATPIERGSLRHPHGTRSAVFLNSAHRVSTSVTI